MSRPRSWRRPRGSAAPHAMLVLVVTEPSVSAEHDRERVLSLTRHFSIPAAVRGNIWDVSPALTGHIEDAARRAGVGIAGRTRYERAVTQAKPAETAVVETETPCADGLRSIWNHHSLQEESTWRTIFTFKGFPTLRVTMP